jgi:glutamate-1-semialdehyde 2,1-aminomutase
MSLAAGARITDVDGRVRIDFAGNMASLIHGQAFGPVVEAVTEQLARAPHLRWQGSHCGTLNTSVHATALREIRFVNSGRKPSWPDQSGKGVLANPNCQVEGAYHGTYVTRISQTSKPENWGDLASPQCKALWLEIRSVLDDVVVFPFIDIERTLDILDRIGVNWLGIDRSLAAPHG